MSVVWSRNPDLAEVSSPDRIALLRLDDLDSPPVVLTDSAAVIWRHIDGVRPPDEVIAAVAAHYTLPADRLRADILQFIEELTRTGLLIGDRDTADGDHRAQPETTGR